MLVVHRISHLKIQNFTFYTERAQEKMICQKETCKHAMQGETYSIYLVNF